MSIWDALVQGIVQGVTEFLPISSDGHLSLVQHFTGTTSDSSLLFTVLLHLGTVFAVFFVFRRLIGELILEFFHMLGDIVKGRFRWKGMSVTRRMVVMVIVAELPLFAFLPLKDLFSHWSQDGDIVVEGISFLATGCLLMMGHWAGKRDGDKIISVPDSLAIGAFQGLAALPGVSRSGSTIAAGLFLGLPKQYAVQFSFVIGLPAILAANVLEIGDAVEQSTSVEWAPVLVGVLVAAVVGFFAIKALELLVKKDKMNVFGIYCLSLGTLVLLEGLYEHAAGQTIFQALLG